VTAVLPPGERLTLDPAAPHPSFPWAIGVPPDWALLDTAPASWARSAVRLVDDRFGAGSLRPAERRAVLGVVEQLVSDCQRAGAALSLLLLGRLPDGTVGSAGLHLGWYDSAPDPAGLAPVQDSLPRTGTVEDVATPIGPALLHTDTALIVPPGTARRVRSRVLQLFLPLPDTTWTAVLSGSTGHPGLHRPLEGAVREVGRSLRRWTGEAAEPGALRVAGP
jgi:hypothetical protein